MLLGQEHLTRRPPAQIGTGWSVDSSSHTLQKIGPSAYYSNSSGVETFRIFSGDERAEIKINNTYSSGSHQFEVYRIQ